MRTIKDFKQYRKIRREVRSILSEDNNNFW
jgi:hypothetical protein